MAFGKSFFVALMGLATFAMAGTPPGMVWINGGEFRMGTDELNSMPNERPSVPVKVSGFWMDQTPVTNAQFAAFVQATKYVTTAERPINWDEMKKQLPPGTPKPPEESLRPGSLVFVAPDGPVDLTDMSGWWLWTPRADWRHPSGPGSSIVGKDDLPVVQVSHDDALAYAKWAGKRLPTEAEWEYASRGGTTTRYYWGNELKVNGQYMANTFTGKFPYQNTAEDGFAGVAPVKAFPPNAYGLYGMAGNVWQWTADLYRADNHEQGAKTAKDCGCLADPKGPLAAFDPTQAVADTPTFVTKGGSYLCNPSYCESYRPSARRGVPPDTSLQHVGFRCVKDVEAPTTKKSDD